MPKYRMLFNDKRLHKKAVKVFCPSFMMACSVNKTCGGLPLLDAHFRNKWAFGGQWCNVVFPSWFVTASIPAMNGYFQCGSVNTAHYGVWIEQCQLARRMSKHQSSSYCHPSSYGFGDGRRNLINIHPWLSGLSRLRPHCNADLLAKMAEGRCDFHSRITAFSSPYLILSL